MIVTYEPKEGSTLDTKNQSSSLAVYTIQREEKTLTLLVMGKSNRILFS